MARRRSKISRLPAAQREFIERLLREDRLTLDEMLEAIRAEFPDTEVSRAGLHRYGAGLSELTARMREIDRAAEALVGELGEGIGEKSGALLAQAVTTLATNVAMRAQETEEWDVDAIRKLAQAAKFALDARRLSLRERQAVAAEAREAALRESRAKLEALGKAGAIDPAVLATVIKAAYDL